ncbi:hypothetical protein [Paenibacillus gallinarum]|uniref:Uncharacterized protein n=1 Tax=Paenibacillus gallinarum TaxID=2762232 RepID=A0ABR8SZ14_9BACL|nr:hypothetical protein [Paenibacillus gallinarum]MBD7968750.1 hypothetical protein [Paenibacillus gallinarum]
MNEVKATVKNKNKNASRKNNNNVDSNLVTLDQLTLIAAILGLIVSGIGLYVAWKQFNSNDPNYNESEDINLLR